MDRIRQKKEFPVSVDMRFWGMMGALLIGGPALHAQEAQDEQEPVKLSAVLTTFLADSAVQTKGLEWTTGNALPVEWESAEPVAPPEYLIQEGFTLSRSGTGRVLMGEQAVVEISLSVVGNEAGVQRVSVIFPLTDVGLDQIEGSLGQDGIVLTPLKCDRKTEGATWGNAVYVAKAPGKTASGLHENWNCGHDQCTAVLSILYRRSDVDTVECAGS